VADTSAGHAGLAGSARNRSILALPEREANGCLYAFWPFRDGTNRTPSSVSFVWAIAARGLGQMPLLRERDRLGQRGIEASGGDGGRVSALKSEILTHGHSNDKKKRLGQIQRRH